MEHTATISLFFGSPDRGGRTNRIIEAMAKTVRRIAIWVRLAMTVRRERHALKALSLQELSDIGLSRDVAEREAARGFLDLPTNRR